MSDNIIWTPRKGASGDDMYRWGSTRLQAGTQNLNPSVATGLNQIIAAIYQKTGAQLPYFKPNDSLPIIKANMLVIQDWIKSYRPNAQFTSLDLPFSNTHILEFRKHLIDTVTAVTNDTRNGSLSGVSIAPSQSLYEMIINTYTYGSATSYYVGYGPRAGFGDLYECEDVNPFMSGSNTYPGGTSGTLEMHKGYLNGGGVFGQVGNMEGGANLTVIMPDGFTDFYCDLYLGIRVDSGSYVGEEVQIEGAFNKYVSEFSTDFVYDFIPITTEPGRGYSISAYFPNFYPSCPPPGTYIAQKVWLDFGFRLR